MIQADRTGLVNWPLRVLIWTGVLIAGLFALLLMLSGLTVFLGGLVLAVLIAVAAWRWPFGATVFFVAFLPVNRFVILLVYHFTGSEFLTKVAQLWKDYLMVVLLARVAYGALFSTTHKRIKYLDFLVIFFITLSACYVFWPGTLDGADLTVRVQGFRSDALFMIAYFVGRSLQLRRNQVRWLLLALVPGSILVSGVAVFQFAMPTLANGLLDAFGYQGFIRLQGAVAETTAVRDRVINGASVPRASSLLLGDLALAFYQIFMVSIASAMFFEGRSRLKAFLAGVFLLAMVGTLVLTITRSAVIAIIPVILVLALVARAPVRLALLVSSGAVLGIIAFLATGSRVAVIQQLANPREESAVAHSRAFTESLDLIREAPLGRGLGTAGSIAQRFLTSGGITNENWYLQLASEMGVLSAAAYLLIILIVVAACLVYYARAHDIWLRRLLLATAGAGIGFLIAGNLLHAWENVILSMVVWLLAGIAVRAPELEASWSGPSP